MVRCTKVSYITRIALILFISHVITGCSFLNEQRLALDLSTWREECFGDYSVSCVNRLVELNIRLAKAGKVGINERLSNDYSAKLSDEQIAAGMMAIDEIIIARLNEQRPGFFPRWFMGGRQYWGKRTLLTTTLLSQENVLIVFVAGVDDYNVKNGKPSKMNEILNGGSDLDPSADTAVAAAMPANSSESPANDSLEPDGYGENVEEQEISELPAHEYMRDESNLAGTEASDQGPSSAPTEVLGSPSFDCSKASNAVEQMVCTDQELGSLDTQLGNAYEAARSITKDLNVLKQEQNYWRREVRDRCHDRECVRDAYQNRIQALSR